MAAKGSILKQEIVNKILSTFSGSFLYNDGKEVRINGLENGEPLQIKLTLTCAKVPVEGNSDGVEEVSLSNENSGFSENAMNLPEEPTDEEKERLKTLLNNLGL